MSLRIRHTGRDLQEISRELRAMNDKEVTKRFRREMRAVAAPFVPAVRASIAGIPVKGAAGSTGLRRRLQKAARISVKTVGKNAMVAVLVDPARMPDGQKALPAYMEGTKPRWRHPVFGNEDVVRPQDAHPYFFRVVRPMGAAGKVAINRVVNSITKDIS